jgi:hypothetical protein
MVYRLSVYQPNETVIPMLREESKCSSYVNLGLRHQFRFLIEDSSE